MLNILLLQILIATMLSYYGMKLKKTKPQWSTALIIMAAALWGLIIAGFWGWLGG